MMIDMPSATSYTVIIRNCAGASFSASYDKKWNSGIWLYVYSSTQKSPLPVIKKYLDEPYKFLCPQIALIVSLL